MHKFHHNLQLEGIDHNISLEGESFELIDVGYIDDNAIPVVDRADSIVDKVTRIACIAHGTFVAFGMQLNWKQGKSEATVEFRGPNATKAKRVLSSNENRSVFTWHGTETALRFVDSYKHLGTVTNSANSDSTEITHKAATIRAEGGKLRANILSNPLVPITRKKNIVQTYVWSKGLYNAGTWTCSTLAKIRKVHSAIMYVYRCIDGGYKKQINKTDDQIICDLGVICPMTFLRLKRVCTFAKCIGVDRIKDICLATSKTDGTWASIVLKDLHWLTFFPAFASRKGASLENWCEYISGAGKAFLRSVARVCRSPIANLVTHWASTPSQVCLGKQHMCNVCSKAFNTFQKLSLHQFKAHGIKAIERRYISSDHCPICLIKFWSRTRVINHIKRRSTICKENLLIAPPHLTEEEADKLDEAESVAVAALAKKGCKPAFASRPCVQLQGPLVQVVCDPDTLSSHHALGKGRNYFAT